MKFPQIIDNRSTETRLDYVLNRIILPFAQEIRIAVGYFYLSGYELISEGLLKNAMLRDSKNGTFMRFVISPRTDRTTAAALTIGHQLTDDKQSVEAARHSILRDFEIDVASANVEAAELLIEHLKSEKVRVRLCVNDFFHAKAYLACAAHDNIDHYYSIVGSSNFSVGGLTDNHELNLGTEESSNYDHLSAWFDELWDKKSVEFNESLIKVIESSLTSRKRGLASVVQSALDPFTMLLFLVRHYLGDLVEEQLKESDQLAEFQRIGAENVLDKLERLGGAIVSDSVGLGKTYTAGEVIRRYRLKKKRVLLVTPPYVLPQWRETLQTAFGIPESAEVIFMSQGKLALMKDSELEKTVRNGRFDLIVVDEAHRARNTETRLHRNLRELHRGSERSDMLLLTATPFNNSVSDLANLVDLAVLKTTLANAGYSPDSFRILRDHFRKLRTGVRLGELERDPEYIKSRDQVREILNAVMLLRMRSTIKERYKEVVIGGKPLIFEDPIVDKISYRYAGRHHRIFENMTSFLEKLKLPHILMANPESSGALNSLYRLLLFKRAESSLFAFFKSLQNIKTKETNLREEVNSEDWEKVLERYNQNLLEREEDDALLIDVAGRKPTEPTEGGEFAARITKEDVLQWIGEDIKAIDWFIHEFFHPIMADVNDPLSLDDPKIEAFIQMLKSTRFRKALVFTEYVATSEYVAHKMQSEEIRGGLRLRFAFVNAQIQQETINNILDRFAPVGRKIKNTDPSLELDLLISTDMLSEGVNLQDADLLVNFDLPWNPMRIVQRVGRVNRIGSENVVRVINFIPDEVLEEFLNLVKILSSKITQVTALLGKEMAILSSDDEEIDPRDIGEALRKVRDSRSVADIELLARKNLLFSALEGETDEDFFRVELFVASRRHRVRPEDFAGAPEDDGRTHYYCAMTPTPSVMYRLYEIHGARDGHRDLLSRTWLRIPANGDAESKHPDEFLLRDLKGGGYSVADFTNTPDIRRMEDSLSTTFERLLEERRDLNSPRNLDKRAQKVGGRQRDLAVLLQKLAREPALGESFEETVQRIRPQGRQIVDELISVLRVHELSQSQSRILARSLADRAIDPAKSVATPAQFKDLAETVFSLYDNIVMKDAALRTHLYTRSEIQGRAVATLYL